jgi:hypothetical protein
MSEIEIEKNSEKNIVLEEKKKGKEKFLTGR